MFGLRASDLDAIISVLRRYPDVAEALMFGSRAMGNFKAGSDVDIALKGDLSATTATDIAVELNERLPLPYKFDVLAYSSLTEQPLVEHIDRFGQAFYPAHPTSAL